MSDGIFSKEKRKIILLEKNHDVIFSKKGIRHLVAKNKLTTTRWVLIPIQETSATYIGVDASKILERPFTTAVIRYHLQYKRGMKVIPDGAQLTEDGVSIAYDYLTTTIAATTVEELYQAIYNMMVLKYIRTLTDGSNDSDESWFMDVEDISVSFLDKENQLIDKFQVRHRDYFKKGTDFHASNQVYWEICEYFGLFLPANRWKNDDIIWETCSNLTFEIKGDRLVWVEHRGNITLFQRIKYVGIMSADTRSFILLTDKEYDQIPRIHDAAVFVTPITLYESTHSYTYLPICSTYGMPKYEFYPDIANNSLEDSGPDMLYNDFASRVYDILTFYIYGCEDTAIFLDNVFYVLQVLFEGCKIWTASCAGRDDIENMSTECTVYLNISIEMVEDSPAECSLTIHTDVYEDYLPNLKEVTYLLQLQEGDRKPF